ncbi:hypothetical protein [Evansella cellulosilytica]|uniref:Uncharacterized protein n=1 Tax=Evansella cellulosilytica (strain ATCC 21833 / DSM 2522 / FERM P-1141 / JCM 9156 / N-4) TaxID=649639 RepID=E6TRG9_EVAC2|nr:hypothetical protein [Evansella cellulosilytica]ADU31799.1 hypothetical protein Bcell_3558 [Evansella cellulosilytica DSM 2522]
MRLMKGIIIIFLFPFALLGNIGCMGQSTEEKMLQYLEETYNEEFEIEFVGSQGGMFSSTPKRDTAVAHLKQDPTIVFSVVEGKVQETYNDGFLLANMGKKLEIQLAEEIEQNIPEGAQYRVYVRTYDGSFEERMKDPKEFIEIVNGNLSIELIVSIKVENDPDLNLYSEGIYNLYELVKGLGAQRYITSIGFVDENEDITEFIRTSYTNNIGWQNLNNKVYGVIILDHRFSEETSDINTIIERYRPIEE